MADVPTIVAGTFRYLWNVCPIIGRTSTQCLIGSLCPLFGRCSRQFHQQLSHPALRSISYFPSFILGLPVSGLLPVAFQRAGFVPQFFHLIDAVAFGNRFTHGVISDEGGLWRLCWLYALDV